jgi:hypothetical protein
MSYNDGVDVLGVGVGDFLPYLNIISSVAGVAGGATGGKKDAAKMTPAASGASGASTAQQIQQAIEQERNRQSIAKMQRDAENNRLLLFGALGLGGLGILALLITRR